MTVRRGTFQQICADLGMGDPTAKRLVLENVLDGQAVGRCRDRWVEYDPGWSRLDLWRQRVGRGFEFAGDADVEKVVKLKIALGCSDEPYDDGFLLALGRQRGARELAKAEAKRRLRGTHPVWKHAAERYAELHGGVLQEQAKHPPRELEDIMEEAPMEFQAVPGTCLASGRGILFEKPDLGQTSRVGAMPADRLRWLATLVILVDPQEKGRANRIHKLLRVIEWLREELGPDRAFDGAAVEPLMRSMVARERTGRVDDLVLTNAYVELRELIAVYLEWQTPDPETVAGAFLHSLLPPELPADLRSDAYAERDRVTVARLAARALTAGQVALRAKELLVSLHARLRQWDRLTNRALHAITDVQRRWDAGEEVELPLGVSDTWKVIRPDGTIVKGLRQRVDFEILTEEQALVKAADACGWDQAIEMYMRSDALAKAPKRLKPKYDRGYAPIKDGKLHVPGGERRLYVHYVGTFPVRNADDEHHPPFLVPLYENSVLVSSHQMRSERIAVREEIVAANHLEIQPPGMPGLTWWVGHKNEALPHLLLARGGVLLLPMAELRLTLAYGTAVARMELLSGMRIGETMQAREGDAFTAQPLGDGRLVPTMRGRPKGWQRDRLWVIDRETMALLRAIKGWVIAIWYADKGALPFVEYGVPSKNGTRVQCPRARYLFQFCGKAAANRELNRCLRIATLGMVHARSHDYRYAFGKLLVLRKGLRRHRAAAMSHDPGSKSAMPELYGEWDCDGLGAADDFVAEYQADQLHSQLEGLIDVGAH